MIRTRPRQITKIASQDKNRMNIRLRNRTQNQILIGWSGDP